MVTSRQIPSSFGVVRVVPPAVEPVSLAEVKAHVRLDEGMTQDDALLSALIGVARDSAERWLGRALIHQTWRMVCDASPVVGIVELPNPPLVSINHIKTYDDRDGEKVFAAENYYVDPARQPGRIVLRAGAVWPCAQRAANGFEVEYVAGYGVTGEDVPPAIRRGILIHVAALYAERGDRFAPDGSLGMSMRGRVTEVLPANAYALYAPYRLLTIG